MQYLEQLLTPEWKAKRNDILQKDKFICRKCSNSIYLQYDMGIIISNKRARGIFENSFSNDTYILNIFTKNHGTIKSILKTCISIDLDKSYVAYYMVNSMYKNIIALQYANESKININREPIHLDDFNTGRKPFTNDTYNYIYDRDLNEEWAFVQNLHVHHNYYQQGKLAWEYPDDALSTLCWSCHEELHRNGTVDVLDADGIKIEELTFCRRCHGAGVFPEYYHVSNGVCFRCNGARYEEFIEA